MVKTAEIDGESYFLNDHNKKRSNPQSGAAMRSLIASIHGLITVICSKSAADNQHENYTFIQFERNVL